MKLKNVLIAVAIMMFVLSCIAHSQDIEEIVYSGGKSNLNEKVKVKGRDSLVLFWDSNVTGEAADNERYIFEELAKKYSGKIYFFAFDVSKDPGYEAKGTWFVRGVETRNEGIKQEPAIAMYKDGKQIDIRLGGPSTATRDISLSNCDVWIDFNLTDKHADKPTTAKYENTVHLHEVPK